jgi:hypothetical protein
MERKGAISDLLLEQYALGELSPSLERKVREELAADPDLRARYEAIKASDKEILDRYPPADMARAIELKQGKTKGDARPQAPSADLASSLEPAGRWALQLAVGLPAAALVLLVFSFFLFRTSPQTRVKGLEPHLNAFMKTAQGVRDLAPGSLVDRGDVIQLSYAAAEARYGVILWVDGRGSITWLLPAGFSGSSGAAPMLDRSGPVILPVAYELDNAPGYERFFLVYAEKPFDMAVAAGAARSLAARAVSAPFSTDEKLELQLPAGIKQFSLSFKKRGPGS